MHTAVAMDSLLIFFPKEDRNFKAVFASMNQLTNVRCATWAAKRVLR